MNSLSETEPKTYSLLSIGQRGAGKTVFLVSSYTELHADSQSETSQSVWVDCEDSDTQQTIEHIFKYVARTAQYPPATMKITNFDFNLKRRCARGITTLCNICWWDTPGESCQVYNPAFLMMVLNAEGYCWFIDAKALVESSDSSQEQNNIIQSIRLIAELICEKKLKNPLAIILTKCDLLQGNPDHWTQLQEKLQPLITALKDLSVNFQIFYSEIPIVTTDEVVTLKTTHTANPILWLVSEIQQTQQPSLQHNIVQFVTRSLPSRFQSGSKSEAKAVSSIHKKGFFVMIVAIATLLGVISTFCIEAAVNSEQKYPQSIPTQQD